VGLIGDSIKSLLKHFFGQVLVDGGVHELLDEMCECFSSDCNCSSVFELEEHLEEGSAQAVHVLLHEEFGVVGD